MSTCPFAERKDPRCFVSQRTPEAFEMADHFCYDAFTGCAIYKDFVAAEGEPPAPMNRPAGSLVSGDTVMSARPPQTAAVRRWDSPVAPQDGRSAAGATGGEDVGRLGRPTGSSLPGGIGIGARQSQGGEAPTASLKQAIREVLEEQGVLAPVEIAKKWHGGRLILQPGDAGLQAKEIPIDVLFKKVVGIRDRLRVLEQKINANPALSDEDKATLQDYVTKSYGSLTTFNVLFRHRDDQFKGTGGD